MRSSKTVPTAGFVRWTTVRGCGKSRPTTGSSLPKICSYAEIAYVTHLALLPGLVSLLPDGTPAVDLAKCSFC